MIAAMVLGGLRRCEVLGLRMEDLRVPERRVFIAEGKGGHQRLVPVSARFFTALAAYFETERPAMSAYELTCRSVYDLTCRSRRGDHGMGSPPVARSTRSLSR